MKTRKVDMPDFYAARMLRFFGLLARGARHREALVRADITWRIVSQWITRPEWGKKYATALKTRERVWEVNRRPMSRTYMMLRLSAGENKKDRVAP